VESLRNHYTRTLEHWSQNFEQALPLVRENKDETFIRMWRLYLNSCAASFNSGNIDLHQLLFSKGPLNNLPWTRNYIYSSMWLSKHFAFHNHHFYRDAIRYVHRRVLLFFPTSLSKSGYVF